IQHLKTTVTPDLQAVGLESATDDAASERRRKVVITLPRYFQGVEPLHALAHAMPERGAINDLSRDVARISGCANLVDGKDVWIVQSRRRLRFLNKPLQALLIGCQTFRKDLDGDSAVKFTVIRKIHLTHSAFANLRADFVTTKFYSRSNGHTRLRKRWF